MVEAERFSAAELLGFGMVPGHVLRIPDDAVLVLTLPNDLTPATTELLVRLVTRGLNEMARRVGISAERIIILGPGVRLESLDDDDLRVRGLRRLNA